MQTLIMVFACSVRLVPNESKTLFEKLVGDNRTYYLDHYVLEEDVTEFNDIRNII
jgi:hypothetical protein